MNKIRHSQMIAGENAVIERLKQIGLIPKTNNMEFKIDKKKLSKSLIIINGVKDIEVLSIADHFVLLLKGEGLDKYQKVNQIMDLLNNSGCVQEFPNIQSMKNDKDYFIITMNK